MSLADARDSATLPRWDETAGLLAGCDKLPILDALEVQRRPTMKKNSTRPPSRKASGRPAAIGMDLGDKTSRYCVLEGEGEVVKEESGGTTKEGMLQVVGSMARCRIAIEVGTHSPW